MLIAILWICCAVAATKPTPLLEPRTTLMLAMQDDEVVLVGVKRARGSGGEVSEATAAAGSSGSKEILGSLPTTLGEGEHERPMIEAILVALRDLSMDVQDLKGAVYMSWEMERDSVYITEGVKMKEHYSEDCKKSKGQGISLGHQKNIA